MQSSATGGRRVVITGLGVLSPAGIGLDGFWDGITCGRSAIREVTRFDASDMPIRTAGEVDQAGLEAVADPSLFKRTDRALILGLTAADHALADAHLMEGERNSLPIGAVIGSGLCPSESAEWAYGMAGERGWKALRPTTIPRVMFNSIASQISIRYHLTGGHHVVAAACASASLAMIQAYETIRTGREAIVLTGGCDSPLTHALYGAWINLRILSRNPEPTLASRPFDKRRDGLVLAEGAAMLVFEGLDHARSRGAKIYGEVIGAGASSDARHVTNPSAEGQALAITRALDSAGIGPEDVDHINAHGTSTLLNDVTETQAIKMALGDRAGRVPISATKSVIGHCMGATGAIELVACLLTLQRGIIPPTVNQEEPDPECDLDYTPNRPRAADARIALSNSFAFGGANAVIAVRRIEENADG